MFSPKFRWSTCTGHKIYRQQNVSRVNCSFEGLTLRRFFSTLHVLDSPLSSNAWFSVPNWTSSFRSACLRLCCCFHHLRSKKTVLLKPSLQTVAINHIKETSHFNKDAILLVFIEITVKSVRWTGLRYLLTDLLLIETKLALVRPEPNSLKAECCSGEDVLAFLSAGFVKTTKV